MPCEKHVSTSRFSVEQTVRILREADKVPVAGIAETYRVSEQTLYAWRKKCSALAAAHVKQQRLLQRENKRPKKMLAERDLAVEMMKEMNERKGVVSASVRRDQSKYAHQRGLSQRCVSALIGVARSTLGYELQQPLKDAPVMAAMRELATPYPRFSYRRMHAYLERQGHRMSWDRAHRLWRLAGSQVSRKRPHRRLATGRQRPLPATGTNQAWAYDFVLDACANGQPLKCLTVIDKWTRECLAIDVQGSIRSKHAIEVLTRLVSPNGARQCLRSDNGPESVSRAILKWLKEADIATALIDPGKPWKNGADDSVNSKLRDEWLSAEWFRTRQEARAVIEGWRRHYKLDRPQSSSGYLSPFEFKRRSAEQRAIVGKAIAIALQ